MGNLKPKSYEESAESEIDEDTNKVGNIFEILRQNVTFVGQQDVIWNSLNDGP